MKHKISMMLMGVILGVSLMGCGAEAELSEVTIADEGTALAETVAERRASKWLETIDIGYYANNTTYVAGYVTHYIEVTDDELIVHTPDEDFIYSKKTSVLEWHPESIPEGFVLKEGDRTLTLDWSGFTDDGGTPNDYQDNIQIEFYYHTAINGIPSEYFEPIESIGEWGAIPVTQEFIDDIQEYLTDDYCVFYKYDEYNNCQIYRIPVYDENEYLIHIVNVNVYETEKDAKREEKFIYGDYKKIGTKIIRAPEDYSSYDFPERNSKSATYVGVYGEECSFVCGELYPQGWDYVYYSKPYTLKEGIETTEYFNKLILHGGIYGDYYGSCDSMQIIWADAKSIYITINLPEFQTGLGDYYVTPYSLQLDDNHFTIFEKNEYRMDANAYHIELLDDAVKVTVDFYEYTDDIDEDNYTEQKIINTYETTIERIDSTMFWQ